MSFFLRNLTIETQDLPQVLELFSDHPSLADHVHHLTFRDSPFGTNKYLGNGEGEEFETKFPILLRLCGVKFSDFTNRATQQRLIRSVIEQPVDLHCRPAAFEISRGMRDFPWKSEEDVVSQVDQLYESGIQLSFKLCFLARGIILKQCKNLKSLAADGIHVGFPFVTRDEPEVNAVLLHGLRSPSLRSISIGQNIMGTRADLEIHNVVFLLLNLPQVTEMEVFGKLDKSGVKFLEDHARFLGVKYKSNVKVLKVKLDVAVSMNEDSDEGLDSVTASYQHLLSLTHQVEKLAVDWEPHPAVEHNSRIPLNQEILRGFPSSSLKYLELNALSFVHETEDSNALSNLKMVEELSFDSMFCLSLADYYQEQSSAESFLTHFPPNLKTLWLTQNLMNHPDKKIKLFAPEKEFSDLIGKMGPSSIPLTTIKTSNCPRDEDGIERTFARKEPKWIEARKKLKLACQSKDLELVFV